MLEQALLGGTSRSREAIMQALGSVRDERATPVLVHLLDTVSHRGPLGWIYARALDLLGQGRDSEALPALETALYRGEWWAPRRTAALRAAAATAIARIGTAAARDVLERAATEGSRGVRAAAQSQLASAKPGAREGRR